MKRILLLILVNMSCYGNTPVKEGILKRIFCCLCPCFKKTPKVEIKPSIRRVSHSDNLKAMDNAKSLEDFKLKVYESNPITPEIKEYFKQNRNLIDKCQKK